VQKLFRFTDSVVFSFDGDAAGRRAAGRALEASLPHASDLRTVRFLFLPPEHDPDSYVRERGPEAFEQQVTQAVPLSRQLVAQASADADLQTAEGRARMLAQAKPLWMALPDGALKRQLLPELARQAQLETADLGSLWGTAPAAAPAAQGATGRSPAYAAPALRRSGRQAPAGTADLALRLLLRHSDWWERLSGPDQALLHGLGGHHGEAVAWLERQLTEHGPLTWAALDPLLADETWHEQARGWINAAAADEEQGLNDLHVVVQRLLVERLDGQARALAEQAELSREDLDRLRELRDQIGRIKASAAGK
jgi:DNA primase